MYISKLQSLQRREFLRRTAALGLAGTAGNLALSLAGIGEAAAQSAGEYKALVCVFLYGGNDHDNSHHMVMGGAVDGGKFWGKAPDLSTTDNALNGDDSVGQGRLLPSTSVDEFAASMARWMGVSDSELAKVLPNYTNFSSQTLPLFKTT